MSPLQVRPQRKCDQRLSSWPGMPTAKSRGSLSMMPRSGCEATLMRSMVTPHGPLLCRRHAAHAGRTDRPLNPPPDFLSLDNCNKIG